MIYINNTLIYKTRAEYVELRHKLTCVLLIPFVEEWLYSQYLSAQINFTGLLCTLFFKIWIYLIAIMFMNVRFGSGLTLSIYLWLLWDNDRGLCASVGSLQIGILIERRLMKIQIVLSSFSFVVLHVFYLSLWTGKETLSRSTQYSSSNNSD